MKNTVITLALAAVLGIMAVACQKETPVTPTPAPTVRNVDYIACGNPCSASVDAAGWHTLLDSLLTAAEGGCRVTFWNPKATGSKQADTVTINTADRQTAYRWGEEMYDKGYVVSIIYDDATGTYRGTAIKATAPNSDYTPLPLANYLPGTWKLDTSCIWNILPPSNRDSIVPLANFCFGIYYLPNPINASLMWQDTDYIHNHRALFSSDLYREEVLTITSENIVAPYPNPWYLLYAQYDSLGFYDSTMIYHYDIQNSYTISLTSSRQLYYNLDILNLSPDDPLYNLAIPTYGIQYITQIDSNYMVIYGYAPRHFAFNPATGLISTYSCEAFGFIRQ